MIIMTQTTQTDKKVPRKFLRKDTNKKKRIPLKWKRPSGVHNKKRLHVRGHQITVRPGFGTKQEDRHKSRKTGLRIILIATIDQLKKVDKNTQTVVLARVGRKKKIELIHEAKKLGITLSNLNADKYEQKTQEKQKERLEAAKQREEKLKEKETKAKEDKKESKKEKKLETQESQENPMSEEDKKKQEKEERDKVLTKGK